MTSPSRTKPDTRSLKTKSTSSSAVTTSGQKFAVRSFRQGAENNPKGYHAERQARLRTVAYWIGRFYHELDGVDVVDELQTRLQWYDDALDD